MAAFHLKGFERFLALKQVGKTARAVATAPEAKARPAASRSRSGSRRRVLAK